MKNKYANLVERMESIENRLEAHEEREQDLLLDLVKAERKCKHFILK